MEKLECKNVAFTATKIEVNETTGRLNVKGYASIFSNEDSYGDIVEMGAFKESLEKESGRVQFCFQHRLDKVCGVINEIYEDAKGLYIDVDILPTTLGKDLAILIEAGAIKEFSIGYHTKEFRDEMAGEKTVRHLTKLKLIEVSAVSRAANPEAVVLSISKKSEQIIQGLSQLSDAELTGLKAAVVSESAKRFINQLIS